MSRASDIRISRVHDDVEQTSGARLLVDRVWPRGVAKAELRLDAWIRDVAPSTDLRKWFGHDPKKWQVFQETVSRRARRQPRGGGALPRLEPRGPGHAPLRGQGSRP